MTVTAHSVVLTQRARRAQLLVQAPRLAIAAVLWLVLIEVLPTLAASIVLTGLAVGTVLSVIAEPMMVRLLWWARRPSAAIRVAGWPETRVLISDWASEIVVAGRQHLVVPTSWQGQAGLPVALSRAAARQAASARTLDVAYVWITWPWLLIGSVGCKIARRVSWVPLIALAWRVRVVVAVIAVWQAIQTGQLLAATGIVMVIGLTYLLSWSTAHGQGLARQIDDSARRSSPQRPDAAVRPAPSTSAEGTGRTCTPLRHDHRLACGQRRSATPRGIHPGNGSCGHPAHHRPRTGRKGRA